MTREEAITILIREIDEDPFMRTEYREQIHEALNMAIKALEQEPKWIPVSERLPEERDWYLAVFKEKDTAYQLIPRVADYIGMGENKWWIIDEDGLCQEYRDYRDLLECIAWMPLPTSYEPQERSVEG